MATTPRWLLDYLASNQAEPEIPHNSALDVVDALVGLVIQSRTLTSPPAATNGEAYLVATGATGDWSGQDGNIAIWYQNQWTFIEPQPGLTAWLQTEGFMIRFIATEWFAVTGESKFVGRRTSDQSYTTWDGIEWNADDIVHTTFDRSGADDEIGLNEVGWYQIDCDVTVEQTSSAAYNFSELKLVLNGSDITGSLVRTTTHFGNQNVMSMHLSMTFYNSTAGHVLQVMVQRHTGAGALKVKADYSRIMIKRV